jgi:hypothetical protein
MKFVCLPQWPSCNVGCFIRFSDVRTVHLMKYLHKRCITVDMTVFLNAVSRYGGFSDDRLFRGMPHLQGHREGIPVFQIPRKFAFVISQQPHDVQ